MHRHPSGRGVTYLLPTCFIILGVLQHQPDRSPPAGLFLRHHADVRRGEDARRQAIAMFISGSMWGKIDNTSKIAIAKEVMGELIDAIPAEFQTGLMVYGHREKGDCKDIEMVVPIGSHNAANLKAKVQAIIPKGKTPLSDAVRQAAQALQYTEERATAILVSDGLETCDIDPCALSYSSYAYTKRGNPSDFTAPGKEGTTNCDISTIRAR